MKSENYKKYHILAFDEVGSTNDEAMKMAVSGQIGENEIVLSARQNAGRGRLGRKWVSDGENLYFSLVLRPKMPISRIFELSFVAIVALRLAVLRVFDEKCNKDVKNDVKLAKNGLRIENKWPNDLLINDKKVAGLLLESANNGDFVIIGIGVNLATKPDKTMFEAACLQDFGIKIMPKELLEVFLDEFDKIYENWRQFGFLGVRNLWREAAWKLGQEIFVNLGDEVKKGVFHDFEENGALLLRNIDGSLSSVLFGDVC